MRRLAPLAALVPLVAGGTAAGSPLKGDGPTVAVAGYGAVWIGTGNGKLLRLDPRTGRITHRLFEDPQVQYGYIHSLAVGFGSVWVAQGRYDTLKRIDPRTSRAVDVRPRGRWTATVVAAGRAAVWVGDFDRNTVFRVDPRTNRVVARIAVPGALWSLAAGPAGAWVVTVPGGLVVPEAWREIRPLDTTRNRVGPAVVRSRCDFALAAGTSSLWVSDLCAKTLTRVRSGMRIPVGEASVSVAVGAGGVWVLSQTERAVRRIDPSTGRVRATIPVRGTWLSAGSSDVWVLDNGDGDVGFVRRIDAREDRVVGRPIRIAP